MAHNQTHNTKINCFSNSTDSSNNSNAASSKVNKFALVTGASFGIGAELAIDLVRNNYNVVLNGRDEQKLAKAATECLKIRPNSAQYFAADLNDFDQIDKLIAFAKQNCKHLDLLVNSACWRGNSLGITSEQAYSEFRSVIKTNVIAPFYLIRQCLENLKPETNEQHCM